MMKLLFISVPFYCFFSACNAQNNELPRNSLHIFSGYSKSGTDNVGGFAFSVGASHFFSKRLSWSIGITTTFHDGMDSSEYLTYSGLAKGAVNFTTSGLQSEFEFGYSLVRNSKHCLQIGIGPIIRYQTSSYPGRAAYSLYILSELYQNQPPARTLGFGGIGSVSYTYTFRSNLFLKVNARLQYDSTDDAFNMFGMAVGKRFSKFE